jgi:hypothetical protein
MTTALKKDDVRLLLDKMPDDATWDDLMHEIFIRQVIEEGLADSKAGRTTDVSDIRRKYGLPA